MCFAEPCFAAMYRFRGCGILPRLGGWEGGGRIYIEKIENRFADRNGGKDVGGMRNWG